jgi:UDP-N-acetylglucosamine--N-acetylmuramyl-(pentapeptide) pyrophosphoryl-undecaprenol N-acetylglucosamine transferase
MRILIAAGGTGGHIYPALAVVTQLRTRLPDLELRWIGGNRGLEADIVPAADIPLERLWLRSLRSVDASVNTILDPLRLVASVPQALVKLLRWRPDVIYTTGGYVAIPVLAAAALLRIPALIWEGNAIPGRSVRLSARLATARSVTFAVTTTRLPEPVFVTGTPIRGLRGVDAEAGRARLGLPPDLPVMLVFGGSQAVKRLNDAISDAIGDLVERCSVVHIAGDSGIAQAEALRDSLPADRQDRYRPFAFLLDDMDAALAAADVLVGRAGSSSLAESAAAGVPMVVVPYPHAAAHQKANAAEMVDAGAAVLVADEDLGGDTLREACDLLFDERRATMSAAALKIARPGAAGASADLLLRLGQREPLPTQADLNTATRGVPSA